MAQENFCQDCGQKHNCKDVYSRMGNVKGSPITPKALVAFLLPLVVFIISLATFERILDNSVGVKSLRMVLSCLLASVVAAAITFAARLLSMRPHNKNRGGSP
jgi:hypothetical protein